MPPGTVQGQPEQQQLIGVRVAKVEKAAGATPSGRWEGSSPTRPASTGSTPPPTAGSRRCLAVTTGSLVQRDELLATFYAPEFFSAMKAYLYGLRSLDRFENEPQGNQGTTRADRCQHRELPERPSATWG